MKRIVASILLAVLIIASCYLLTVATQNRMFLASVILLCIAVLVKINFTPKKKTSRTDTDKTQRTSEKVYVFDGGRSYHSCYSCQYVYAKNAKQIDKAEAKAKGLKPCKKCYPYGD